MDTITRQDQYFDAMSGGSSEIPEPITRKEQYYAKMAGEDVEVPEPITREEYWLHKIIEHGGGGGGTTTIEPLTVTENGSYSETGKAYSPVNVNVPQPSGSTPISENGVHNVTAFAEAVVNVPNSYSASDEGKVVSNGALVAQTSQTIDTNGTYDTTLKNEVVVNVSGGGGASNIVTGIISPTVPETMVIDTGYTGAGYPLTVIVENTAGWKNVSGTKHNNVIDVALFKMNATVTPSDDVYYYGVRKWSDYGTLNLATISNSVLIKSATDNTTGLCMSDNTTLNINFVGSGTSGAGFPVNVQYRYVVMYSE